MKWKKLGNHPIVLTVSVLAGMATIGSFIYVLWGSNTQQKSDNTQIQRGSGGIQVNKGNVTINSPSKAEKIHVLRNSDAGITLVRNIPGLTKLTDKSTHVCKAVSGTSIELLDEPFKPEKSAFEWQKVKIKDGQCKGKVGWVSTGAISYE